jgi:hypothetical protein
MSFQETNPRRRTTAGIVAFVLSVVGGFSPAPAIAADALSLGNTAFRAGLYANAIRHYGDAIRDDGGTPLVHYNTGVAHYKLGDYAAAEASFLAATNEPRLAARSFYNLGLVERAKGEDIEARMWFVQARHHASASPNLRKVADRALAKTAPDNRSAQRRTKRRLRAEDDYALTDFVRVTTNTRVAYDSNVYRAPDSDYVDIGQAGSPTVTPEVKSGYFAPVQLLTEARWGRFENSRFHLRYLLNGRYYFDSEYSNANTTSHSLIIGGKVKHQARVGIVDFSSDFVAAKHDEQGFNRDDGESQSVSNVDVSDRLSYTKVGPRLDWRHDLGWLGYGIRANAYIREYEQTTPLVDYSHEELLVGGQVFLRPDDRTYVKFNYDVYWRDYQHQPARSATGARSLANPTLDYEYHNVGGSVRHRLTSRFWARFDYAFTKRDDGFVGYDDYDRHTLRGELNFRARKFTTRLRYTWRDYEFPNGFAFDVPAGGDKDLTVTHASLIADYRLTRRLTLNAEGIWNMASSTDLRSEYERTQVAVGVRWDL